MSRGPRHEIRRTSSATPTSPRASCRASPQLVGRTGATQERPLHIMEICGGHTHAIFRYGLHELVPEEIEFIHGPGLSGLRAADGPGRRLHRHRRAAGGDLHHLRRRHAGAGNPQEPAAGQGRRRRHPPRLLAARRARARPPQPRPGGRLLRARLRDDDAVDRTDRPAGRQRRDRQLLAVLQPHHGAAADQGAARRSRHAARRLRRPRPCQHGDRHAALRLHRARLRQADRGLGLRAARPPAVGR